MWAGCQQVGEHRGRVDDLFEVVDHQQQVPAVERRLELPDQVAIANIASADRAGDGMGIQTRIGHRSEGNEPRAVTRRADRGYRCGEFNRYPRLPNTTGSGKVQEPNSFVEEQRTELVDLSLPANQPGERSRQSTPRIGSVGRSKDWQRPRRADIGGGIIDP